MPDDDMALVLYRGLCTYLTTRGWRREEPGSGWWYMPDGEDADLLSFSDAVDYQLNADDIDTRNEPITIDEAAAIVQQGLDALAKLPPWPTIAPHPDDNLF